MTREVEMNKAFKLYEEERKKADSLPLYDLWEGFKAGFKYADSHPQYFRGQTDEMMERESLFVDDWFKEHKGERPTYADAIAWANRHLNGSVIHWQTGEPTEEGEYLVQLECGDIRIINWQTWRGHCAWVSSNREIVAWYPLIEIKPYKEDRP